MSAKILVLSASYGEGHNAAARAVVQACEEAAGPGSARMEDVFALAKPRMNEAAKRGYLAAINRTPKLWSRLYRWMDGSRLLAAGLDGWLLAKERAQLLRLLRESGKGTVLCSTYPAYAFMLRRLQRDRLADAPLYTVVTDSISVNSLWHRAGSRGWLVPNEDTADAMRHAGVPSAAITVTGFPVNLFFDREGGRLRPTELRAGARPRVLQIINSGTRGAEATALRLLDDPGWDLTCAVGRDQQLQARLQAAANARGRRAEILGWTDRMPELLLTHHAVISKAGGATTQEAIAARCPMIVNQVVPGQEEGNFELLRRHEIGGRAETPEAITALLRKAFAERGALWSTWRRRLTALSRPQAARAVATLLLASRPPSEPLELLRIP